MGETLRRLREYCGKLPNQAEAAAERCIQVSLIKCHSDGLKKIYWENGRLRIYLFCLIHYCPSDDN